MNVPDHYAVLGLDRGCTREQIRAAYRLLAKRYHPDRNADSAEAHARTQALNAAYATLGDPARRRAYDRELADSEQPPRERSTSPSRDQTIRQDVYLRLEEFLRGATLDVKVNDPGNVRGAETYALEVPPETAPGSRLRIPRTAAPAGGTVLVRLRARPGGRLSVRGSDLRCELRIPVAQAAQGGCSMVNGVTGRPLRVTTPAGVARGEIIRLRGEGLPKARGGRGDLLVRVTYRPEVRVARR